MSRIVGILAIVLGVWIGMEVFTKGTSGAFGGLLVRLGIEKSTGERIDSRSVPTRFTERHYSAHQRGIDRVERQLDEE